MDTTQPIVGLPPHDGADDDNESSPGAGAESAQPDSSRAAAQLLEMTAREIDRWRSEAQDEAATIVATGREEAEGLLRAARTEADRLLSSARGQAATLKEEAQSEADRLRQEPAVLRERHDAEVAHLREVETQHRQRLRQHLTDMLDQVGPPADRTS